MKKSIKNELILFSAPLMWGLGFPIGKVALSYVTPGWMNFFRCTVAFLLMLPFMLRRRDRWNRGTLKNGLLLGTLLFLNFTFNMVGLNLVPAGENAFLTSVYVVMTPFFAWLIKKKRPLGKDFLCAAIAICGIAILSLNGGFLLGRGELISLCTPVVNSISLVLTELYAKDDDAWILTGIMFFVVAVLSGITAPLFGAFPSFISFTSLLSVLYMGIAYTGLAFCAQNYSLAHTSAEHAAVVFSTESVLGWIFGVLLLNEPVTLRGIVGGALVFLAIIISTRPATVSSGQAQKHDMLDQNRKINADEA